ncbi:ArsR/SmtB family transcription factor [Ornithinibacillus scapharcae]|uniref:ArsR/SmtB family transcription factor n=1 Tax=Ornithinibacillus scapharcae TaxID=1147159 RepID=UPI000225BAD1|nr:metalloregulator ArsR/SmtB family transcription factor [Ornithinibacillus scapharcae]
MASEREENQISSEIVVDYFHSTVVEAIALLSSYVNPTKHEYAESTHDKLSLELSKEAKQFIQEWQEKTDWDFMEILNFLLPFPYFHHINQFLDVISSLSHTEYLYHFLWEDVPSNQIEAMVDSPASIDTFDTHILWETKEKKEFIVWLFTNIKVIRKKIAKILIEVSQAKILHESMDQNLAMFETSIQEIKSLKMEPLNKAQYVMGKTFRRTSLYKMYYFIPSYFFTPHRIRLFNSDVCFVIYGCGETLSDTRDTSVELEVKFKALADRNRLMILHLLSGRKEYGAKLAEFLGITTATVSHHLEILKKAGFIKEEKVGNIKYFSCNKVYTDEFLASFTEFIYLNEG